MHFHVKVCSTPYSNLFQGQMIVIFIELMSGKRLEKKQTSDIHCTDTASFEVLKSQVPQSMYL